MTGRSYLSIGDVLTLLREEFPDVTISKIRFLESQGLVNPERSPSGYRKFFEADVERLRWVLRQQREHFLPLKVIRDRLADGDVNEPDAESYDEVGNGKVPEPVHATAGAGVRGRARTVGAGSTTTVAPPTQGPTTPADDDAMARILADASRRAGRTPGGAVEHISLEAAVPDPGAPAPPDTRAQSESAAEAAASTPAPPTTMGSTTTSAPPRVIPPATTRPRIAPTHAPPATRESHVTAPDNPAAASGAAASAAATAAAGTRPAVATRTSGQVERAAEGRGHAAGHKDEHGAGAGGSASAENARPSGTGRPSAAAGRGAAPPEKRTSQAGAKPTAAPSEKVAATTDAPPPSTVSMVTGASLTTEELCAASGLSESELAGLQGFGLIEPVLVAGIPTFDEDALTVANLAADFRKFGIEARHLRPYRNAVDREMGLIEQVIIPLLRQRNPESRQRAAAAADELGALGQTMRATLMRSALRRHVGG